MTVPQGSSLLLTIAMATEADVTAIAALRVAVVSVDSGDSIGWEGRRAPPADMERVLERRVAARNAVQGRIDRTHDIPVDLALHRSVLAAGVDLIGLQGLSATRALLASRWNPARYDAPRLRTSARSPAAPA